MTTFLASNLSDLNRSGTCIFTWSTPIHECASRQFRRITTIQAALFAGVEVHLLTLIKDESNYRKGVDNAAKHALLIFTYSALFFSISATISGLILTDEFRELPVRASRKKDPIQQGVFDSGALDLLQTYGAKRSWIWVMWHCERSLCKPPNTLPPLLIIDRRVVLPRCGHHFSGHPGAFVHLARRVQLREDHPYIRYDIRRVAFTTPCSASPGQQQESRRH